MLNLIEQREDALKLAKEDQVALTKAEKEIARLTAELKHWQTCENCGEPLHGPGICDQAVTEREKGLELMHEEALTRAEKAEVQVIRLTDLSNQNAAAAVVAAEQLTALQSAHETVGEALIASEQHLTALRASVEQVRKLESGDARYLRGLVRQHGTEGFHEVSLQVLNRVNTLISGLLAALSGSAGSQ